MKYQYYSYLFFTLLLANCYVRPSPTCDYGNAPVALYQYWCAACHISYSNSPNSFLKTPNTQELHSNMLNNEISVIRNFMGYTYHRQIIQALSSDEISQIECYLVNFQNRNGIY